MLKAYEDGDVVVTNFGHNHCAASPAGGCCLADAPVDVPERTLWLLDFYCLRDRHALGIRRSDERIHHANFRNLSVNP